jgi:hypothetical protein
MLGKITEQNTAILKFACDMKLTWSYFTSDWIEQNFDHKIKVKQTWPDILVTLLK